jgi:AraC-like DNA-binding protein
MRASVTWSYPSSVPAKSLPTVAIDVVRGVFAEAIARGQEPAWLCAHFGVSAEQLADANARLPVDQLRRIWDELPRILHADDFGLSVARRAQATSALGVIGHVVRAAATVGHGLRLALRYQRLVTEAIVARWLESGDEVRVSFEPAEVAFRPPRHAIEFGLASLLLIVRGATDRPLVPRHVAFRHARPPDDSEARRVFGCELTYAAPVDQVAFPRADLDLPVRSADPYLAALLQIRANELEEGLPKALGFAARVRSVMCDTLADGETSVDAVARRLRVNRRSLQRGLQAEGTTFQQVLNELRRDLAMRHLEEGKLSQQEIAFLLGFSEQSAFQHAFVRWTGQPPGAYRAGRL